MKLSRRQLGVLYLILANMLWGASIPIYKWTLEEIPAFTFVFVRFFASAILLFSLVYKDLKIAKNDIGKLLVASLCGITINLSFLFFGLKLAPSINASVIASSSPILLIIFAVFVLREKTRMRVMAGTMVSMLGIFFLILTPFLQKGANLSVLGNFFFLVSTLGSVVYIVIMERIMKRYPPLVINFWTFLVGSVPLFPLFLHDVQKYHVFSSMSAQGLTGLLFGIFFAGILAHTLFAYGVRSIKTGEVGIFSYIDPVTTVLVAIPLLGEKLTTLFLLGALLVFGGIYIAEGRIHYHPIHLLKEK